MLKSFLQDLLDGYHSRKLDELDWVSRNRLTMKPHLEAYEQSHLRWSDRPDRLKVAFWSLTPWERGGVEHMMALSLKARGHRVSLMRCGGGKAACSMESVMFPRPDCSYCQNRNDTFLSVWGLGEAVRSTAEVLTDEERQEIAAPVEATPAEELKDFCYLGYEVGAFTVVDLPQYFMRLVDLSDPEVIAFFRKALVGSCEVLLAAERFLDQEQPDRAVVTSGRTISHAPFYHVCKRRGVPVVTWDEATGGLGSFNLCLNDHSAKFQKPIAWDRVRPEALRREEQEMVDHYFSQSARGRFGRYHLYAEPITDRKSLIEGLGLREDRRLTLLLTNLTWDTAALNKSVFFKDMIDWITATIDHYMDRPEEQLVVRTHPGEGHLADFARGRERVSDILHARYPKLPSNILIVSGAEEYNSHALCELASAIVVLTTTVGLEMAARGRRVLSVGDSHYRGKGFTVDVETEEEYFRWLDGDELHGQRDIPEDWQQLAVKYAYYYLVRMGVHLDEFNLVNRHECVIPNARAFLPGESQRWDAIVRDLEELGQFVDCTEFIDPWKD